MMDTTVPIKSGKPLRRPLARASTVAGELRLHVRRAAFVLVRFLAISRQRRALLELDEHMLQDIGRTRADVEREASRPFWDDAGCG